MSFLFLYITMEVLAVLVASVAVLSSSLWVRFWSVVVLILALQAGVAAKRLYNSQQELEEKIHEAQSAIEGLKRGLVVRKKPRPIPPELLRMHVSPAYCTPWRQLSYRCEGYEYHHYTIT